MKNIKEGFGGKSSEVKFELELFLYIFLRSIYIISPN